MFRFSAHMATRAKNNKILSGIHSGQTRKIGEEPLKYTVFTRFLKKRSKCTFFIPDQLL
jgi:hypothetical protein